MPAWAWQVASNADGDLREHADVVEITDVLDLSRWDNTGLGRMPSRHQAINAVWLELALIAADLLALAQSMLLTDEPDLAKQNPRRCATGCYTPPPGSPADSAKCSCAWPSTGPGHSRSPERSNACGSFRSGPDGQHHHRPPAPKAHGHTGPGPALPHAHVSNPPHQDHLLLSASRRFSANAQPRWRTLGQSRAHDARRCLHTQIGVPCSSLSRPTPLLTLAPAATDPNHCSSVGRS